MRKKRLGNLEHYKWHWNYYRMDAQRPPSIPEHSKWDSTHFTRPKTFKNSMWSMFKVFLHMWMHICVHVHVCFHGGHRPAGGHLPSRHSTLLFETRCLTEPGDYYSLARLGQKALRMINLSLSLHLHRS